MHGSLLHLFIGDTIKDAILLALCWEIKFIINISDSVCVWSSMNHFTMSLTFPIIWYLCMSLERKWSNIIRNHSDKFPNHGKIQVSLVGNPHLTVSFLKSKTLYIWRGVAADTVHKQRLICFKLIYVNFPQGVLLE